MQYSKALVSIDEALACIKERALAVTDTEELVLSDAAGRFLAAPARSKFMAPPFDNAAMDGMRSKLLPSQVMRRGRCQFLTVSPPDKPLLRPSQG